MTDDGALVALAFDIPGLRFVPEDDGTGRPRGIDAAVAVGADAAGDGMPRAALLGDLPSLRPEDLGAALDRGRHPSTGPWSPTPRAPAPRW